MQAEYINPFLNATITVFKTMFGITLEAGTPRLKAEPCPTYDVSGIIGLAGNAQGSIGVSFPEALAIKFVSIMIDTPVEGITREVTDGIGEIANIIAGNAKKDLKGLDISISLPQVVIGKNHKLSSVTGTPAVMVPFKCEHGEFVMELSLRKK